ncbi:uncharacterized protein BJX67DRAFT_343993 [Aspergillus lucknowensis]|uniref:Uncharacterized protein n=1 Tax=Aspergillus lucknowensis TaxID=176173 RepID=A0ABR4M3V6_9EURO
MEQPPVKEDAVEEPSIKECAVKEPPVEGWPSAPVSLNKSPYAELPDAIIPPAKALTKIQAVQNRIARILVVDIALYENWESLSLKKKAKRASKLAVRGLPVPSKDGFISIFVA